ncbi:hypothetical protein NM04_11705 [Massilia aurea]|uniref:Uncharacterized protein n=1 Tax=Massilia aurea TaxID=373040 RepID=A0A422QKQ4_9BURK|nr:hypothetical protein [Massilia aurea]RNF30590.1 hypothetical protein NM04_11705 [Massilia aurea]
MLQKACACLVLAFPLAAMAQQPSPEPKRAITFLTEADETAMRKDEAAGEAQRMRSFQNYPVGKVFWFKPSRSQTRYFYQRMKPMPSGAYQLDGKITPTVTASFKVLELVDYGMKTPGYYGYRIEFEDGTPAFIEGAALGYYSSRQPIGGDRPALTDKHADAASPINAKLFTKDPDQLEQESAASTAALAKLKRELDEIDRKNDELLAASARAQEDAAARESRRRGGVRIGMTTKQVRASNWGKPESVNRTTSAAGIHEQWVYGDGNYLYFENGVLTTIQN